MAVIPRFLAILREVIEETARQVMDLSDAEIFERIKKIRKRDVHQRSQGGRWKVRPHV